ncbi:metallophosphoesterase [Paracoccus siganidrum]|uniref:Serine/threonine protein phosphatase n=1 Tax=Paracoccus siganidrum TaxID=1276757 RepID=A0A419A5N7_9RHOB|nr:metallophosphoesterase [Paracoccus siganidrum]RJL12542.1 serine/threonine protein phosphatase [Paracoccus siganidrum]RMC37107.1 serine/threonine protein phosphatase [Paracoccus siganidrum]
MRLYAIGDIHGQLDQLHAAHERVFRDGGRDALIVHVGDLIDRGPDSRGVVDYLMTGRDDGRNWVVTRGNHDRFLPKFLADPGWIDPGLSNLLGWVRHPGLGAAATLASYGLDPELPEARLHAEALRAVPPGHARFLAGLPLWFLHPLALVVHAGIRPGVDLQDQAEDDLVWIRKPFLESRAAHGPLVVHGHTALSRPTHHGNRLNIDGGAGHGRPLAAVVIEPGAVHLLTDGGRQPLLPE